MFSIRYLLTHKHLTQNCDRVDYELCISFIMAGRIKSVYLQVGRIFSLNCNFIFRFHFECVLQYPTLCEYTLLIQVTLRTFPILTATDGLNDLCSPRKIHPPVTVLLLLM
jgi:hypothetical protein